MYHRKRSFDAVPEPIRPRSDWQEWDYPSELFAFAHRLQEPQLLITSSSSSGGDYPLLAQVFTHRSFVSKQQANREQLGIEDAPLVIVDNEQLIKQGQEILDQFLSKYLRYHLRLAPEECIQSLKDYLLSKEVLGDISKWIGCIDLILCEEFPPNEQTLANTVLALIGALNESNKKRARNFIIDFICTYLNGIDPLEIWRLDQMDINLNRYLQTKGFSAPTEARIMAKSAIGTIESCYMVGIYQDDPQRNSKILLGQSAGESLKIAKRMAELDVLRNMFGLSPSQIRFQFGSNAHDLNYDQYEKENFHFIDHSQLSIKQNQVGKVF